MKQITIAIIVLALIASCTKKSDSKNNITTSNNPNDTSKNPSYLRTAAGIAELEVYNQSDTSLELVVTYLGNDTGVSHFDYVKVYYDTNAITGKWNNVWYDSIKTRGLSTVDSFATPKIVYGSYLALLIRETTGVGDDTLISINGHF